MSNRPVSGSGEAANVGKSTVFNTLTGLRQHTNWTGKTVALLAGTVTTTGQAPVR